MKFADLVETVAPRPARRFVKRKVRRVTGPIRTLPDFLIIGAQRSGTTSLWNYLAQHPRINRSYVKEIHFFSTKYHRGLLWYRLHFPSVPMKAVLRLIHGGPLLSMEASPNYLFHPLAASRVARAIPDARLIVLLRNPIDRAWSHYQHNVRQPGREPLTFEDAIAREEERLAPEFEALQRNPMHDSLRLFWFSYLSRGRYLEQLTEWLKYFPRDRFLIEESESFYRDPGSTYRRVLEFLQLPAWEPDAFRNYSYASGVREPGGVMDPDTRDSLQAYFASHNERLYEFLGRRFSWDE